MAPTVESACYSVGTHNSTRVDEGRKCTLRTVVGRRAFYVTLDLSYDFTEGNRD